ncbi:hypothetical protein [Amycolatopsis sp. DG1A-15b]|uniref:hypothetical protein n=1 Tax=Amycolatopsis sp. DG1A-15b TaxID=3052846 RepID=UPI00255C0C19|nr:hypothetical protein [Amycolatopsis sp. DG1A-15b]WIX88812.1 hypothetical protein QRY02_48210 [Amycolatopsis sp. DG1A-15b]
MTAKQKRVLWHSLLVFAIAVAMMFFVIRTPTNWIAVVILAALGFVATGLLLRVALRPPYN